MLPNAEPLPAGLDFSPSMGAVEPPLPARPARRGRSPSVRAQPVEGLRGRFEEAAPSGGVIPPPDPATAYLSLRPPGSIPYQMMAPQTIPTNRRGRRRVRTGGDRAPSDPYIPTQTHRTEGYTAGTMVGLTLRNANPPSNNRVGHSAPAPASTGSSHQVQEHENATASAPIPRPPVEHVDPYGNPRPGGPVVPQPPAPNPNPNRTRKRSRRR